MYKVKVQFDMFGRNNGKMKAIVSHILALSVHRFFIGLFLNIWVSEDGSIATLLCPILNVFCTIKICLNQIFGYHCWGFQGFRLFRFEHLTAPLFEKCLLVCLYFCCLGNGVVPQ